MGARAPAKQVETVKKANRMKIDLKNASIKIIRFYGNCQQLLKQANERLLHAVRDIVASLSLCVFIFVAIDIHIARHQKC